MKYAIGALCLVLLLLLSFAGCVNPPSGPSDLPGGPRNTTVVSPGESTTVTTGEFTTAPVTTATTAMATTVATPVTTGEPTTAAATTVTTTAPTGVSTSAPRTPDTPGVTATTGTAVVTTILSAPSTTSGAEIPPTTTLPLVLIGIVGVAAIIGIGWMLTRKAPANDPGSGAAVDPGAISSPIRIISAPPAGSTAQVVGTVDSAFRADHRVLVYINVRGRWWGPKPEGEDSFTRIEPDGTWRSTILTGGEDHFASEVAAYLVPSTLTAAPPAQGIEYLPIELREYPFTSADR